MDETKTNPASLKVTSMDEEINPNWHPETWGGPRPGSGRPTLGGDEDPTVTVTVMMPLSLKLAAIEIGDGNMSRGIREAIAVVALYHRSRPLPASLEFPEE